MDETLGLEICVCDDGLIVAVASLVKDCGRLSGNSLDTCVALAGQLGEVATGFALVSAGLACAITTSILNTNV